MPITAALAAAMPYYAVARGRAPGIYPTWGECSAQVQNFSGARYKKFGTESEAREFINGDSGAASGSTGPPSPSSTVASAASAEDPSGGGGLYTDTDVLRGGVIKYVKGKIDDLREKKVEFGQNADVAARNIRAEFDIIRSWLRKGQFLSCDVCELSHFPNPLVCS